MSYFKVLFTIWLYFVSSDIFNTVSFHCIFERLSTTLYLQTKRYLFLSESSEALYLSS